MPLESSINKKKLALGVAHLGFPRKWCQTREEVKGKKLPEFPRRIGGLEAPLEQEKWKKRRRSAAGTVTGELQSMEWRNEREREGGVTYNGWVWAPPHLKLSKGKTSICGPRMLSTKKRKMFLTKSSFQKV